jgi:hypothetical protein
VREPGDRNTGIVADETAIPIANCGLDLDGLRCQLDRYRTIAPHLDQIERRPGRLDAWLAPASTSHL